MASNYANFGTKSCAIGFSEDATWGEDQTYDAVDASRVPQRCVDKGPPVSGL